MKTRVIKEECIGCSLCAGMVPEVFTMTEEGVARATEDEIPVIHHETTREASESCPVGAIEIYE